MNFAKQYAKEAWMKAKKQESTAIKWEDSVDQGLAKTQFERWWEINYE